ncbi:MAG: SIR2 family protein [Candidatus Cloacimonetes bacterium]|nr:SIR2 family protein [Candidatus Cloacimonadota bacterium]
MNIDKREFLKNVSEKIKSNDLAYFIGAGVSKESGFMDWKEFMKDIIEDLNLDYKKENDLITIAQYHKNTKKSRNQLNDKILNAFSGKGSPNEQLSLLCQLPVSKIWTTNYDKLIEYEFEKLNKKLDVKISDSQLTSSLSNPDATLIKMHGDISDVGNAIITRQDYEYFDENRKMLIANLINDINTKTFIFIGYSFSDPNFNHVLSKIRIHMDANKKIHYYITKKETGKYNKIKQKLRIDDLKEYGIQTLLVDEYNDIVNILKEVRDEIYKNNVFISGSAIAYDEYGTKEEAGALIESIAKVLIDKNCKVLSGHGLGVGEYVVQGILKGLADKKNIPDDPFELKIFPQKIDRIEDRVELWKSLRENLISKSKLAIFMFGNKNEKGTIIDANGMVNEFEIALKYGLKIIILASTGYTAKKLSVKYNETKNVYIIDETDKDLIIKKILQIQAKK